MGPRAAKQGDAWRAWARHSRQFGCVLRLRSDWSFARGLCSAVQIVTAGQGRKRESQRLLESDTGLYSTGDWQKGARPVTCMYRELRGRYNGRQETDEFARRCGGYGKFHCDGGRTAQLGMPSLAIRAIGDLVEENFLRAWLRIIEQREVSYSSGRRSVLCSRRPIVCRPDSFRAGRASVPPRNLAHFLDQLIAALPGSPGRSSAGSAVG